MKAYLLAASALLLAAPMTAAAQVPGYIDSAEAFVGIGGGNYNKDLGEVTGGGFAWNARLGVNGYRYFGAELQYQGLNGSVNTFIPVGGVPTTGGNYTMNAFTGNVKAGVPVMVRERELRPYVLAGLGYARLSTEQQFNNLGLEDHNALAIPLGIGATYQLTDVFAADARFNYNILTGSKGPIADSGDSWMLGVNVGARFGGSR